MIDIVIIGAGPSGLCAAKTFLQYDSTADILIVDANASVGGVWAKENLYPTLKTNNLFTAIDFTDFPMSESFGIKPGEHVTGEVMSEYVKAYAAHFGLTGRIQLNTKVVEVRTGDGDLGWKLLVEQAGAGQKTLECRKLVVATGALKVPHMPSIQGADQFGAPFLHSSEMGPRANEVFRNPEIKTIAVIGGSKSSYDAVYLAASTGHRVEWVIRKSGRGPCWVFPPHTYIGPIKAWREKLVTRRFFSFLSPCVFPDFSGFAWLRRFFHFHWLGKAIAKNFWNAIREDTVRDCGYKTDPSFGILEPEHGPFWYGTSSGTLNYEQDIFSFVKSGQVRVHREDILSLSEKTLHLSNGTGLSVDAIVASTGYSAKPAISFQPADIHSDLGVPSTELTKQQKNDWAEYDSKADFIIGSQFPQLLSGPLAATAPGTTISTSAVEAPYSPWRLYRGIAPPGLTAGGDHSLVFLSMFSNIANTLRMEIQCLWAVAYLSGNLPAIERDIKEERVFDEAALMQRFVKHRAPLGHGSQYPDLVFDQVPYWDVLLHDLGLRTARKGFNPFRELFSPYEQADYRNMVQEWVSKTRRLASV